MAGTIESLDFEVILKDDKFKKSIDNDLKLARDLNTKLTDILNLKKRLNSETTNQLINAEKVRQAEAKTAQEIAKTALEQQKLATEVERTRILQEKHTGAAKKTTAEYVNMKSVLRTLSQLTGVTFSVVGIRRFLESMIDITGQFEVQRMALRNMLQDVDGADKIFEDLYRFSSDSTYRFSELAKYAKQLSAFNIDKGSLLETTKMLGDVASGVGVSMDRLILAYGHVKSSGFLRGIQLRSFSQNGVPILEELSKMFTETEKRAVSLGDVFDRMMKREIPFEMVEEAFRRMTSEGGKFYQMQEVLAKTLAGQINILKGRWENMLAAVGQANNGIFKNVVTDISTALLHYDRFGKAVLELVSIFGAYRAALLLTEGAAAGLTVAETAQIGVMNVLNKTILANPYALFAAAITTVGYAIYKVVDGMESMTEIQKTLSSEQNKYTTDLTKSVSELDLLYGKLKLAAQGTDEYNTAVRSIQSRYGDYIEQLRGEGVAVDNLAEIYDKLREKVENAAKARFVASARSALDQTYGEQIGEIFDRNGRFSMTRVVNQLDLDAKEAGFLKMMIAGVASEEELRNLEEAASLFEKIDKSSISYDAGDTGPVAAAKYIENLRKRVAALNQEYNDGKAVVDSFAEALVTAAEGGGKNSELTFKIPLIIETIKGIDKDIKEIRDKAKSGQISVAEKTELAKLVADRKEQTDLYKEIMGVDYDKDTRRSASASEKAEEKARNAIKTRIALLEKYLSTYQKIEPIKGDKTANWMADTMGGDASTYKDLEKQITDLTAELRGLGDAGKETADAIEARLGLDAASQLVKQFNAEQKATEKARKELDKYLDALEKWTEKEKALEGAGMAYKVSKAIADYRTATAEAERKYREVTSMPGSNKIGNLQALLNMGRDQNGALTKLKNNITGFADGIIKDVLEKGGYDLSNWNDKTLSQILEIKKAVNEIELPAEIKAMLDNPEFKEILEQLEAALKKQKKGYEDNTIVPEEMKKYADYASKGASYLTKISSSMREVAEATGDANLAGFAEALGGFADTLSATVQGAKSGGVWGALAAMAVSAIDQIVGAYAKMTQEIERAKKAVAELKIELVSERFAEKLESDIDSIFGENLIRKMRNAGQGMDELKDRAQALRDEFVKVRDAWADAHFRMTSGGGGQSPAALDAAKEAYKARTQSWEDLLYAYTPEGSFWGGTPFYTLREIAEKLGMPRYDDSGNPNAEFLQKVIDVLGIEDEYLKSLIAYSENYENAVKQMEDVTNTLFDSLSSDLTDNFIENFKTMGNAVDDLGATFENLGETILKSLLNSYVLDNILDEYKKEATSALAKYAAGDMTPEGYAEWLAGFTARVQDDANRNADAINSMIAAFADRGLLGMDSDSSDANSLGNGIKGITEETASLLASYLNAIRADVSVMRALQEKGWENIEALAGVLTPSLADYVQQIAANTYNAAQDTNAILAELRSVIGPAGTSGDVVRVEMA